jgi:uncharacterized short protein YbdD (DUF466 family)
MIDRIVSAVSGIARALRAILGVPDYDRYLANVRECNSSPLTREEFYRDRLNARYSTLGSRCC